MTRKRRAAREEGRAPRRWPYRSMLVAGAVVLVGVGAWQLEITLWTNHSSRVGRALVHQFLKNRSLAAPLSTNGSSAPTGTLGLCGTPPGPNGVEGVISIPKLNVVAPVLQGTDDAQLNVAVGHDPYSVWPGSKGNAVLEAHDVSYFQNLPDLTPGDQITYESPCTTYSFVVESHSVVAQGAPVYDTPTPTMTLVTCWPTNALWYTPDRYLVTAVQTSSQAVNGPPQTFLAASAPPAVPVPAELAQQGVTLATYSVPMGTMALAGTPDPAWAQTTNPLLVESSGVEAFIAGLRSLNENRLDWWKAVAPTVTAPTPLVKASTHFDTPLNVTIQASGASATGVDLTVTVDERGGDAPGRYAMVVHETITNGTLVISSWRVAPS